MQFVCACGSTMNLSLRTVIFSSRIEIDNVPIFTCESCHRSEVYAAVKGALASLLDEISRNVSGPEAIRFEDHNELVRLIMKASDASEAHLSLTEIVDERINELLDIMLLAQSLNQPEWVEEARAKLRQITDHCVLPGTPGGPH